MSRKNVGYSCFVLQILCLLTAMFGDIGFDHPGKYGLDFNAVILLIILFTGATILALMISIKEKMTLMLCVEVSGVLLLSVIFFRGLF